MTSSHPWDFHYIPAHVFISAEGKICPLNLLPVGEFIFWRWVVMALWQQPTEKIPPISWTQHFRSNTFRGSALHGNGNGC